MFERRLKIVLLVLLLLTMALMARAAQVQVLRHTYWKEKAEQLQTKVQLTETTRGEILDINGKPMAIDVACTDVAVAYQAVIDPPDPKWVAKIAQQRLEARFTHKELANFSATQTKQLRADAIAQVQADIKEMWDALADWYQPGDGAGDVDGRAAIDEIRRDIVQDVEAQRRLVWYRGFAKSQSGQVDEPRWRRWLAGLDSDGPDMKEFDVEVSGEVEPHVILHAVDAAAISSLGRRQDRFPGMSFVASTRRFYPMKDIACHLLGRMSQVGLDDLDRSKDWDITRQYQRSDQVGRTGIEALCEPLLRGSRGRIERRLGDDQPISQSPYLPGQNVTLSIDADLQAQVQQMLQHVRFMNASGTAPITPEPGLNMHAAAVVIDIKTGEVRVLASNPTFDVNDLNDHYAELMADHLNDPLRDRATCDQFEPGSTVKPIVGLGAITDGLIGPLQGIECTGYLMLPTMGMDGRMHMVRQIGGRCWVASEWAEKLAKAGMSVAHHPIPTNDPHRGHDGNPDGWLTFRDALERSCNVYFETVADRLGQQGLIKWYTAFGFGRRTGIGIEEEPGLIPGRRPVLSVMQRMSTCFAGIGEGQVWATPLQIANEAATVARNGVWMRPRLLTADSQAALDAANPPPKNAPPSVVDLNLDPAALREAKLGMIEVVNRPAGTGTAAQCSDMIVAGKTGSAQGARLWEAVVGPDGRPVLRPDGRPLMKPLTPDVIDKNGVDHVTATPWYRADTDLRAQHAWFMGFAPADKPEIAFSVLVEYAGAGGNTAAGPIVKQLLEACVQHHYLHPGASPLPLASAR